MRCGFCCSARWMDWVMLAVMTCSSGAFEADDGDRTDVLRRLAAEVVGQAHGGLAQLARTRPALQLQVHLVEHADAAGADRVAEALEATVDLAGDLAVGI